MIVLANLPYLAGFSESNPLGLRSQLTASASEGPLPGYNTIDPNAGAVSQANGHRAALDVLRLRAPWWNPYEGTGTPLAGEMQSAALFAPTWLSVLSNGQLYERLLLELLGGLATYLLLRRLALGRTASTVGGIAFALNGTYAWFAFAAHVKVMPFLPLLLLGIENAYAAAVAGRRGGWRLLALAGALSFYAGFPEAAYINVVFSLFWLAWRGATIGRERLGGLLAKTATGAAVGLLLAAPLLVAFVGYLPDAYLGVHDAPGFADLHLAPQALPQMVLPYVYGPISAFSDTNGVVATIWGNVGGYLSIPLLFLALLGLIAAGHRGLKLALAGWIALATARTYGMPVLGGVLGLLPGMGKVAFYRYANPTVELAMVVLAAFGLDAIATRKLSRAAVVRTLELSLAVLVAALLGARHLSSGIYTFANEIWALLLILAVAPLARLRNARVAARLCGLVLVADAFVLFLLPEFSAPRGVRVDMAPVAYLRRHLGESRYFGLGPIQPNYGSYFGLASLSATDLPVAKPFARYINTRLDRFVHPDVFVGTSTARALVNPSARQELVRNLDGYRAAAVAYVLTSRRHPLRGSPSLTQVFQSRSTRIYRLAGAEPYFSSTNPHCTARSKRRTSAQLTCPAPSTLVRRETDLPGWTARVDGRVVPIRRYQGIFQAVPVAAGAHRITFSYRPRHIVWGYAGFLAGCAWLLLSIVRGRSWMRTCTGAMPGMPEA